jgi:hypothetical protein
MPAHDSDPARALLALLREAVIKPHEVARTLDSMSHVERVQAIRAVGRAEQRRLYEAVAGFRPLRMTDAVPASAPAMTTVRHLGRNTLPIFSRFEKRVCRPADADPQDPDRLWGYNFSPVAPLVGPGFFVLRPDAARGELLVDYHLLPEGAPPAGWPAIRSNERGLARFVYGFMIDTLRGVSEHVTIGSAARRGKDLGSWFLLCREA